MKTRSQSSGADTAFDFKGRSTTLTVMRLRSADLSRVDAQLTRTLAQAPDLLRHAPVAVEVDAARVAAERVDLAGLTELLERHGLVPVAVCGGDPDWQARARAQRLGVLPESGATERPTPRREAAEPAPAAEKGADKAPATLLVNQPVRSGQQIYARGGDLIVLAPVSPGAEVIADGHIHVYGPLRGRALAGARGNRAARIFCQSMEAELVAIAGHYRVSEDLRDSERARPVQIHLDEATLCITPL